MKVHRFYEVFHKDADVVVEELSNCIYMYGRTAHTGFPESCLERFTDELSEKRVRYNSNLKYRIIGEIVVVLFILKLQWFNIYLK